MAGFNFSVKVYPFAGGKHTRAFASVVIEDVMEIKGFKVVDGRHGLFVSSPQTKGTDKKTGEDTYFPDVLFHEPRDPENGVRKGPLQQELEDAIVAKYKEVANQNSRGAAAGAQTRAPTPDGGRPDSPFGDGPAW